MPFETKDIILLVTILTALVIFAFVTNSNIQKLFSEFNKVGGKKNSDAISEDKHLLMSRNNDATIREDINLHSVVFEYSDVDTINQFYAQVFKDEYVSNSKTFETVQEKGAALGVGGNPILNASAEGKSAQRQTENFSRREDLAESRFLRYFNKIEDLGAVTHGLENVEIELSEIQAFDNVIEQLKKEYQFSIPEDLLEKHRQTLRNKREQDAQKTIRKFENIKKPYIVLVKGDFKISRENADYVFVYDHPVNKYLSDQSAHITISFKIPARSIAASVARDYEEKISNNQSLERYICGKAKNRINSKEGIVDLQLRPIVVYY